MMCIILPESVCKSIAAPMRKIIKHAGKFSNTLLSSFHYLNQGLQLTDLHARIIQNHISTLTTHFNSFGILSGIYHHRIHNLQEALWTPIHPFDITDFTVWKYTKTFLNDLLCRTLHFTTLLNISYDSSTLPLLKYIGSQHPIHAKFITDPKLYALQTSLLKQMNIRLYAQCIDPSGTHLLSFQKIVELYASHLKISRPLKWYTFLRKLVTANSDSMTALALQAEFCILADNTLNRTQTSSVTSHQFSSEDIKKI